MKHTHISNFATNFPGALTVVTLRVPANRDIPKKLAVCASRHSDSLRTLKIRGALRREPRCSVTPPHLDLDLALST